MEGDLYATKGVEYLLVVGYLLLMVVTVRLASKTRSRRPAAATVPWFRAAEGLHFHPGHAWALPASGDILTVGLDDFAARLIGTPDGVDLPAVGATVRQGEAAWSLRLAGRALDMVSPVEGEVVEVNQAAIETPALLSRDPYGEGWLLKVRAPRRQSSLRNLLSGELAALWMRHTAEKLRSLPDLQLGAVMPDGGVPVPGFARALEEAQWQAVVREFFLTG